MISKMKALRALFLLIIPVAVTAHPGGGLIAMDANTVIFGDPMNNVVWRLEKGRKPQALVKNFHAHWTTRGLDGQIYSESFQDNFCYEAIRVELRFSRAWGECGL